MAAGASRTESSYSVVIGGTGPIFLTLPGMSALAQDLDGDYNPDGGVDMADVLELFNMLIAGV